jgi:hypothetical protein
VKKASHFKRKHINIPHPRLNGTDTIVNGRKMNEFSSTSASIVVEARGESNWRDHEYLNTIMKTTGIRGVGPFDIGFVKRFGRFAEISS